MALAGDPGDPSVVAWFDPVTLAPAGVLRRSSTFAIDPATISRPESIEFPTTGERTAHALYYPPTNPAFVGPDGEKPPLVVLFHGGPTSNALTSLDLGKQLLTSRGIAVVDVDYGGSTGYGREYRQRLDGNWGVVDVDDGVAAALFLVERGDVDPERLAIEGGSAGGYTTLAALAFRDVFSAGISLFGIADLEVLELGFHKFESRYSHRLVGPYPEAAAVYRERSPIHSVDAISCPVLVIQGLDDTVVPPEQADIIVAALAAKGIPHAYLAFEGEGHGFRGAYAIRRTIEAAPVVPRPGLRFRAGRRHRTGDPATGSRRGPTGARAAGRPSARPRPRADCDRSDRARPRPRGTRPASGQGGPPLPC